METVTGPPFAKQEQPLLPTRVIDLGLPSSSGEQNLDPRLIHTEKSHGNYVALSYRSFIVEQSLCTTRENLGDHLQSIPWTKIPKTFQHAIQMTKDLGMRYIWIDLLCIVQDDRDEWLSESNKLGSVFEGASLVIADSIGWVFEEGLFTLPRPHSSSNLPQIPYHDASGAADGAVLYIGSEHELPPAPSEIYSSFVGRAWVTQEYLLARRIAFFTLFGVVWSCRSVRVGPDGVEDISTRTLDTRKWSEIIQQHVLCDLKHPADRLVSLEGIRTKIQKRDGGTPYRFGMFEKELQMQLMWRVIKGQACRSENPLVVPSWSWASSLSRIRFFEPPRIPEPLSSVIDWEDCGKMSFEGNAVLVPSGKIRKLKKSPLWKKMKVQDPFLELYDNSWDNTVRYDEGEPPGLFTCALFALLLCTKQMKWPDDRVSLGEYFIVLRRISKWDQTYERVGAGMSCNHGLLTEDLHTWSTDCKVKRIRIV